MVSDFIGRVKFRVLQSDQPGVLLAGTDVISSSDPWRARMVAGAKNYLMIKHVRNLIL